MAEKKKRQTGSLRDVHIRLPSEQYNKITETADRLNISNAEYISKMLNDDGVERLYAEAKRIQKDPKPIKIRFDGDETKDLVSKLIDSLNNEAEQLRRIGSNLSGVIRYIRGYGSDISEPRLLNTLEILENRHKELTDLHYSDVQPLYKKLLTEDGAIYKGWNIWDEE